MFDLNITRTADDKQNSTNRSGKRRPAFPSIAMITATGEKRMNRRSSNETEIRARSLMKGRGRRGNGKVGRKGWDMTKWMGADAGGRGGGGWMGRGG